MPKAWREVFVVPYGPGHEELGTSRGGELGAPVYYARSTVRRRRMAAGGSST